MTKTGAVCKSDNQTESFCKRRKYYHIGVMGGMGARASSHFYDRVISAFQENLGAQYSFEFPEMFIHNIPVPDNVGAGVVQGIINCMLQSIKTLTTAGADFIAIPCNSVHIHIKKLQQAASIPVLDIVAETLKVVGEEGCKQPLLLGTRFTISQGIYDRGLDDINLVIPTEADQNKTSQLILRVCAGEAVGPLSLELMKIIEAYPMADGVILGCTELPLIVDAAHYTIPIFDTLQILVDATFRRAIEAPLPPKKR